MKQSKSSLAVRLSALLPFSRPNEKTEQYSTDSEVAADILWKAFLLGDIRGRTVADLGAGTGILGIGAILLGAKKVYFVENDMLALPVLAANTKNLCSAHVVCSDVMDFSLHAETVVQNPPFGTRQKGADVKFLLTAMRLATCVYSLHKTSTIGFIQEKIRRVNPDFSCTHIWDYSFALKMTLAHHRRRVHRIDVSCLRFQNKKRLIK